ncbi:hypothetical protein ACFL0L_02215 [Patescibacteria group bacterium]
MIDEEIQKEIGSIKERNKRVEADKAWELSWTRRIVIAVITYIIAGIWLEVIKDSMPWLKAFIPTGGFVLSLVSLPVIKKWWIKRR